MGFLILYIRLAMARAGLRRIIRTIQDERAIRASRRGDARALMDRPVDLSRHLAERRSLVSVALAFTAFIFAVVSGTMHWEPIITLLLSVLAVGLFVLSIAQSPGEKTTAPSHLSAGRNDPCPCGSGKKYKHCLGASNASAA